MDQQHSPLEVKHPSSSLAQVITVTFTAANAFVSQTCTAAEVGARLEEFDNACDRSLHSLIFYRNHTALKTPPASKVQQEIEGLCADLRNFSTESKQVTEMSI